MEYKLEDLFDLKMGKTPARSNKEYWNSKEYKWISISDLTNCKKYISETKEYISKKAVEESGINLIPANTVVMSFKLSLGKTAITREPMYSNEAIMSFRNKGKVEILPEYLYYLFSWKNWDTDTNKAVMGKTLNKATLSKIKIKVHEIEKQRRIVGVLNKVNSVIDERKLQLQKLENLVSGRFVEMFGDPRRNQFEFDRKKLKNTCSIITGNTPSRKITKYYGDYIEWIKTDNIVPDFLNPTSAIEKLSKDGAKVGRVVDKGAVLMACIAGSIASIGKVCVTDRTVAFNQQINAIVPEKYNIFFLHALLRMSKDYLTEDINMSLKGILSKSKLGEKEFIVPPIELQNQFANFVRRIDKSKLYSKKQQKFLYCLLPAISSII